MSTKLMCASEVWLSLYWFSLGVITVITKIIYGVYTVRELSKDDVVLV